MIAALLLLLSILLPPSVTLTPDGTALLAFKYSIVTDPASVLADWNYDDDTPCSWNGVVCMSLADSATNSATDSRVIGLVLPNTRLVGVIPDDLGLLSHLRHLDLSGNSLNSTLPPSILDISDLLIISLAGNAITGQIPQSAAHNLQVIDFSGNGFTGRIPASIAALPNLTTLSVRGNFLTGELPIGGFRQLQVLDLSSNLLNGTIPADLSGSRLNYLNLSNNRLTGEIPPELGLAIPAAMTIDLSFNNLSGEVPTSRSFQSQKPEYFAGNIGLCGKLLNVLCQNTTQPPSPSPAVSPSMSPPAIAVIPKIPDGNSQPGTEKGKKQSGGDSGGLSLAAIVAITVGDMAGIGLLFSVFLCVYRMRRKRHRQLEERAAAQPHKITSAVVPSSVETKDLSAFSCCLTNKCGCGSGNDDSSADTATSDDEDVTEIKHDSQLKQQETKLVTLDGESELEMETLLKASAYILGVAGSSIVYKAVLENGTTFAVRRIGESGGTGRMKDFESQIRSIAKLRHPNLLRLRGFYWAANEKLLISDYASNGSLSNISFVKKHGSSPFLLRWDARLRTARGIARGLAFLHEKRCIHGNIKPSNILLSTDMEPWIADYGLDRLIIGSKSGRTGTSARHFGSKRSLFSQNNPVPELSPNLASGGPSPAASSTMMYQAPESLQNLKPSHKWDVFSFGMVLLELMAGRVFSEAEVNEWNSGFVEEGSQVVRMADPAIRGDVQGKEEALLSCFRLGFCCAADDPQRRPTMKEALVVLERVVALASGEKNHIEEIREAQFAIDLPNVVCVDAKGLPLNEDNLHLTTEAHVLLGSKLVKAYVDNFLPYSDI